MDSCSITYVREARVRGTLFGDNVKDGAVSCADTQFWVDHKEPSEALKLVKEKEIVWLFGELQEGHEFLVLVKFEATEHFWEGTKPQS